MSKMRLFKFWNETGTEKEKESMSLKKAVISVQGDAPKQLFRLRPLRQRPRYPRELAARFVETAGAQHQGAS